MKILAAAVCCRRARVPGSTSRRTQRFRSALPRTAQFVVRQPGTVAGIPVAAYTVASVCSTAGDFELTLHAVDGDRVGRGDVLISVTGNARALLAAERVSLNLITMMSGVATATRAWADALAGTNDESSGLAEDDSRPADAAKVRRPYWRRYQSPDVIG